MTGSTDLTRLTAAETASAVAAVYVSHASPMRDDDTSSPSKITY